MASSQRRAVPCAAVRRISRCRVHRHLQLTFTKCGEWPKGITQLGRWKGTVRAGVMYEWSHGLWAPITADQLRPTALTCEAGKSLAVHAACTCAIYFAQFLPFLPGMVPPILPNLWFLVSAPSFCLLSRTRASINGLMMNPHTILTLPGAQYSFGDGRTVSRRQ